MSNNLPNRKPTSPNPSMSMSAAFAASQQCGGSITSPMKYRRSTSFPGKVQGQNALHHGGNVVDMGGQGQNNLTHGPIDMNAMDDAREQFMQYQVSFMQSNDLLSIYFFHSFIHSSGFFNIPFCIFNDNNHIICFPFYKIVGTSRKWL